jgi:hypothetical protein
VASGAAVGVRVPVTGGGTAAGSTVADLVDDLGDVVRVVHTVDDLLAPVREVVVHDPLHGVDARANDLVLGVGIDQAAQDFHQVCRHYAELGVAALVIKGQIPEPARQPRVAVDSEPLRPAPVSAYPPLSVLEVPARMEWGMLLTLLRAAQSVSAWEMGGGRPFDLENLFALSNVLASRVDAPVVLHDAQGRLLAYSGGDDDLDDVRRDSILGRRAPQEWLDRFRADGSMARLVGGELVHFGGELHPGLAPRLAVAIKAGSEMLGTMWLLRPPEASAGLERAVREAADVAALQLVRSRISSSAAARAHGEVFATLLSGSQATPVLAERIGIPVTAPLLLVGFRPAASGELDIAVSVERLAVTLRTFCDAYRLRSRHTVVDGTAYLLLHLSSAEARPAAVRVLRDVHRQVNRPGEKVHAATGRLVNGLGELARPLQDVRVLLDMQAEGRLTTDGPADLQDCGASLEYEQLRRLLARDPEIAPASLRPLLASDAGWVETLRAVFDAGGDANAAGQALGVHQNTVRYRLRRIRELFGLDLDDPTQRFVVELHVRLFT